MSSFAARRVSLFFTSAIGCGARQAAFLLVGCLFGVNAGEAAPYPLLSAHVPDIVAGHAAKLVGVPAPGSIMHLVVALPLRNSAQLDGLLRDIYDPASPAYRHYLSVAEYTARFGPRQADYDGAARFFKDQGLNVTAAAPNRYIMDVEGSTAKIERVFHVRIGLYRNPEGGRHLMAPDREPTLDLAVPVLHVTGLDDVTLPSNRLTRNRSARFGTGSGPDGNFIGSDIRAAYYGNGPLNGAGQSLGLMELEGYEISDVQNYFSRVGQSLNVPVIGVATDKAPLGCTGQCVDSEQTLDIIYSISMAPALSQVQVYVGNQPVDVLNRMASDNTSKQLSTSWGWGKNFSTEDNLYKEFAVQGQSFVAASGDESSLRKSGPWPEEDANLTAVGGTDLTTNGGGGAWTAEIGWSGSGGGPALDKAITIESYQLPFINTANGGSKKLRNVPDIAGAASNFFLCGNGGCGGGGAGTSFAAPIWAGFIALANQQAASAGQNSVGFLNPALYALGSGAGYDTQLHDVTSGTSGKYTATLSYDLVTGLGTPGGQALIDALTGN